MKYKEFIRNGGKAGLSLKEFAELIKINRISLSNYSQKGKVPDHLAVIATLMGILPGGDIPFVTYGQYRFRLRGRKESGIVLFAKSYFSGYNQYQF